jgi:suppressor for copper-sensitivity B
MRTVEKTGGEARSRDQRGRGLDAADNRKRLRAGFRCPLPLVLTLVLSASAAAAVSGPWVKHPEVQARLVSGWSSAPNTGQLLIGAEFSLTPGWHAYWKNPGDAGYPPRFAWTSRPAAQEFSVLWPAPRRFLLPGDLQALGYADRVIYPVRVRFPAILDGKLEIEARVDYLVCADTCIPYRDVLRLEMPTSPTGRTDEATMRRLREWRDRVPARRTDDGARPDATLTIEGDTLSARFTGLTPGSETPQMFLETHPLFDLGPPARRPGDELIFDVPIRRKDRIHPLPPSTTFDWTLTGVTNSSRGALEGTATIELSAGKDDSKP